MSLRGGAGRLSLTEGQPDAAGTLSASLMLHLRAWRATNCNMRRMPFPPGLKRNLSHRSLAAEELVCLLNATTTVSGSGPLPDAGAQLRACFVSYGPVSISQQSGQGGGWALTARATATAFAENSLGELDSYEKTLELSVPIPAEVPAGMPAATGMLAEYRQRTVYLHRRNSYRNHHRPG